MSAPNAPFDRVAALLEEAARELRTFARSSGNGLASLRDVEAECGRSPTTNMAPGPSPTESLLMTADEVAADLKIHRRTLDRMIAAGEGPKPIKVRGATRFRRAAVERWITRQER